MSRITTTALVFLALLFGTVFTLPRVVKADVGEDCTAAVPCGNGEVCADPDDSGNGVCLKACTPPEDAEGICEGTELCVLAGTDNPTVGVCKADGPTVPGTGTAPPVDTSGAGNLGAAKSGNYGLGALTGTNLYQGTPETIVLNIVKQVFFFIGALLVALIVYGGMTYMLSAGNEARVKTAKQIISAAIVGAIITFAAYLIAELVIRALSTT